MRRPTYHYLLWILAAEAFAATPAGKTSQLPPLGQRVYLVSPQEKQSPVIIKKEGGSLRGLPHVKVLKDPVHRQQAVKVEAPAVRVKPKPLRALKKAGQLRFSRLKVSGHLIRPRVEFRQEFLPLDRADEPVGQDFYDRVFQPAKDDTF